MPKIEVDVPGNVLIAENTDERAFARELRMQVVVKVYEFGRLSSGQAEESAGGREVWIPEAVA